MPAIIAIASAVIGGAISSSGSRKAAQTQADAANNATAVGQRQYEQTRTDQLAQYDQQRGDQIAQLAQQRKDAQPYRDAGYGALSQLAGGTRPSGEFNRNFTMADYQEDPGYQFRMQQGEQGINRAATASGSRYSGATLKALSRFNSGLASQEYGNAYSRFKSDTGDRFNRLSGLAGTGQTAVNQGNNAAQSAYGNIGQAGQNAYGAIGQAGQNNATNAINSGNNAAAARASGYVGVGNAINSTIGTLANNYQQQQYLNRSSPVIEGATNQTGNFNHYGTGYSP